MPTIVWLALAAAIYPQLLAIVVVILTRPDPKRLLWACYLAGIGTNVGLGVMILLVFRARDGFAGSTSHRLGASVFLVAGGIALVYAVLQLTPAGRRLLKGVPVERLRRGAGERSPGFVERRKRDAQGALTRGSLPIAILVGVALGLPGPFDMLAIGRMAAGGYALLAATLTIIAFSAVKFTLIEVPIAGYALDPDGTADRVGRFAGWMRTHHTTLIALVVGGVGLLLLSQGFSRIG